jgi:hypothetical protein
MFQKLLKKPYFWALVIFALIAILAAPISYAVMVYSLTPSYLRKPQVAHHHFRLQLIIEGNKVNFADSGYQETYEKNICSGGLTKTPLHFHDGQDQIVHIHWADLTGGDVLKYYGMNRVGGFDDTLGYRIDKSNWPEKINIKGKIIPSSNKEMFVYTGTDEEYTKREAKNFLNKDLESFFGKKSKITQAQEAEKTSSILDNLWSLKTEAHGNGDGHDYNVSDTAKPVATTDSNGNKTAPTQEELEDINDLIGNVVIFIQDSEPTNEQVKDRFDHLQALQPSVCGG